ncbi:uncharacterized protein LOC132395695 isoform X1 [Hypanus sabinus]|uniref:uncharacterized protein LOC132395695 isoform X1 n=1 Tax=Hypanus sabinus TaxID=79690 RepID=UPI0028C44B45|nr:uncharacterized protein LOC132395695 isoform X1 [Hypanus sabinus]
MFGLMIRQAKKHPSLIPLFTFISLGISGATLYLSRMALFSPDVRWILSDVRNVVCAFMQTVSPEPGIKRTTLSHGTSWAIISNTSLLQSTPIINT